jgi:hypothetical protein
MLSIFYPEAVSMASYCPDLFSLSFKNTIGPADTIVLIIMAETTTVKTEQKARQKLHFFLPASLRECLQ